MHRVVITGMGAITPVGSDIDSFWQSIVNGELGIAPITRFDTAPHKAKVAAEVKDFEVEKYIPKRDANRMDLYSQFAVAASQEAVDSSGLDLESVDRNRFGVIVGSGIGGMGTLQEQITKMALKGPSKISPLFIPMCISNIASGHIAIRYGAKGICTSITTACSTGANCIGEAFRNIKHGYSDVILAGGAEASITDVAIAGFTAITAHTDSDNPKRASIPFDMDRSGFVMGEGAGIVVVESLEHAQKRGAKILAEIVGYGSTCDAYHMTLPVPDGNGAIRAMQEAVKEAEIGFDEVGYINAHGTSTDANDKTETHAVKEVFGEHAYNIPVSSTKSMIGHLLGAAGAVEAIICVKALETGIIPPTVGLEKPDPDCDLNYVPNKSIKKDITYAISNSFGFGGHNAVLCIKKWEGK